MERRQIVKIIEEICKELNLNLKLYSDEWLIVIDNGEKRMFIHSYRFPNNDSAVSDLCNDKSGLSEFLLSFGVPCISHSFYWLSGGTDFSKEEKELAEMFLTFIEKYKGAVVKPNNGTGGSEVYKICDKNAVFEFVKRYKGRSGMIAISPFVDIETEYRTVVCGDEIMFTFEKIRPSVTADGKKSYFDYIRENGLKISGDIVDYVPKEGEKIPLVWKHNLQGGAKALLVENPPVEVVELVESARKTTGVKFASIDVVKVDGKYYVLEINSGVMMEKFSKENEYYYNLAKNTYKKAIKDYFMIK